MSEIKKDWESILTKESYLVTREGATERPFSGEYWDHFEDGSYKCICCGTELFKSNSKFDAGCGWPSFFESIDPRCINEIPDHSVEKNEVDISKEDNFEFNQDNSIEYEDEYRSPGWNRYKKNKILRWKK